MVTTEEQVEQILKYFAIGLLEQEDQIHEGSTRPVTLSNSYIQHAWDHLTFLCLVRGIEPPSHLPNLVHWLHQPVETWIEIGKYCQNLGYEGSLLDWGRPTELCSKLGGSLYQAYNPRLELQDEIFKRIYQHCDRHNLTSDYSLAREFLNRNPVIENIVVTLMTDTSWNDEVRNLLKRCYEPIPANCRRIIQGQECVVLCPHCNWTLQWRDEEARCHKGSTCREVVGNLEDSQKWMPISKTIVRTTEGIQRYVVTPEVELVRLSDRLRDTYKISTSLWPNIDSFDLYFELPNGRRYAVDMKDVHPLNIRELAQDTGNFNRIPEWDVAYYLFPNYRANASYLALFDSYWNPNPELNLKRASVRNFWEVVRKEMEQDDQ